MQVSILPTIQVKIAIYIYQSSAKILMPVLSRAVMAVLQHWAETFLIQPWIFSEVKIPTQDGHGVWWEASQQ